MTNEKKYVVASIDRVYEHTVDRPLSPWEQSFPTKRAAIEFMLARAKERIVAAELELKKATKSFRSLQKKWKELVQRA